MLILTPTDTQQIAEIAHWLSTQDEEMYQTAALTNMHRNRNCMLGEMRFLVNAAHAPGVTSDRIALFLGYLKERQSAIVKINLLLDIE